MRKTKIICTIGPATETEEQLQALMEAGMNVARLNFSHGSHAEHGARIQRIRKVAAEAGKNVAVLLDTKGPEIRLGKLAEDVIELHEEDKIILTTDMSVLGTRERIPVTYAGLPGDVRPGAQILIDDGLVGLTVERIADTEIYARVVNSGPIKSSKGVNVPGVNISLPGITEKDAQDIIFATQQGVDFIAASFVRKAADVLQIKELLEQYDASGIQIIAKIENEEGVHNLDEILEVSDGLMVARGDLGVEIPAERVPIVQKQMISKCNQVGKPVVTATQMLDSMQRNPRPTRAEASDVANAIFDGTDAIMLSGETAIGKYPVEAVETMAAIAIASENAVDYHNLYWKRVRDGKMAVADVLSSSVASSAMHLGAKAIISSTESGYTARLIAKYRPEAPIIAVTPRPEVLRSLAIVRGVETLLAPSAQTTDEMFDRAVQAAVDSGIVALGDTVVITAGVPVGHSGTTNVMKIHTIGELLARGQGIGSLSANGEVVIAHSAQEAVAKMSAGAILVADTTDKDYMPALVKAAGIITVQGGVTSHAAIVALNLGIPVVLGVSNAFDVLHDEMEVTVYAQRGYIYSGLARVL
jgi:pyruvate kinase